MSWLVQQDDILIALLVMINFIFRNVGFLTVQVKLISFLKVIIVLDYDTLFLFKILLMVEKEIISIVSLASFFGKASFKLVYPLLAHPYLETSAATILLERRSQALISLSIVGALSLAFWLIQKLVLGVLVEASIL